MLTQDAIRLGIHPSCKKEEVLEKSESSHAERMQDLIDKQVQDKQEESKDLSDLKMNELRKLAKGRGIKTPFGMKKEVLINLLKGAE